LGDPSGPFFLSRRPNRTHAGAVLDTDVLIVGGGLSGLALAHALQQAGRDYLLIDARDRFGGRVTSRAGDAPAATAHRYDLGPAWFWPGHDRVARLVDTFGLQAFEQYSIGNLVFQDERGAVRRDLAFATMAGALRLADGIASLTDALAATLPDGRTRLRHTVRSVARTDAGVEVTVDGMNGALRAGRVVCAVPPRIVADTVAFEPALTPSQLREMRAIPTWMAGHAKLVAVYDRPFWREAGLSGDGVSQRGPLAEIHDASPPDGSQGALFGFVGVPAAKRIEPGFDLESLAVAQLAAMFGPDAGTPRAVLIKDWAKDPLTATPADFTDAAGHPPYGLSGALRELWNDRLALASTETAPQFGGFLEGALEAAAATFADLQAT